MMLLDFIFDALTEGAPKWVQTAVIAVFFGLIALFVWWISVRGDA